MLRVKFTYKVEHRNAMKLETFISLLAGVLLAAQPVRAEEPSQDADAGVDTFVAGSAVFGQPSYKAVIDAMRAELAK